MDYKLLYACLILCRHYIIGLTTKPDAQRTWNNASVHCKQNGGFLPIDRTAEDHRKLVLQMQKVGITSTWLGIRKTRHPTWIWLDGQPADHEFAKQNWRDFMNCGVLHLRDSAIEVDRCSKRTLGYVCEHKTKTSCSALDVPPGDCVETHGRVLVYGCDSNNWYDARFRCNQKSMDLALMRSEAIMGVLRQKWYRDNRRSCEKLWMGLRREDWHFPDVSLKGQGVMQSYWRLNQPSDTGNCGIISKDPFGQTYSWSTASCDSHQNAMCMSREEIDTTAASIITSNSIDTGLVLSTDIQSTFPEGVDDPEDGSGTSSAAIVVPIVFVITGVGVAVIVFVTWRKRKGSKYPKEAENATKENEEMKSLSANEEDKFIQADHETVITNNNMQTEMKNIEEGEVDELSSINSSNVILEDGTFHFANHGGFYEVPDSDATITFPRDATPCGKLCSGTIEIVADMAFRFGTDTKVITPLIMFNLHEEQTLLKHVMITLPHAIQKSKDNVLNHIKTYEQLEDDEWVLVPQSPKTGDVYFTIEEGKVVLYTKRTTNFLCTCDVSMLGPTNLSALVMVKYDWDTDGTEELMLYVYVLDALYDRKEFIEMLPDEAMDKYEHISLLPSALPHENQYGKFDIKVELQVDEAWQFVELSEGKEQHFQRKKFTSILPSEDSPVGQEAARFIIRRTLDNPRVDTFRYSILLTVHGNDIDTGQISNIIGEHQGRLNLKMMKQRDPDE